MTIQPTTDTDKAALLYRQRGWPVFPIHWLDGNGCSCGRTDCSSPAKHPVAALAPRGLLDATTDPDRITAWWQAEPRANIGIATGAVSGLVVADLDGRSGENAFELLNAGRPVDPTATVYTGGGGLHYYYVHPGSRIGNTAGRLGAGLDVRGDGGYAVVPPSIHASGQPYVWLREAPFAPMPEWLRAPEPNLGVLPTLPTATPHASGYVGGALRLAVERVRTAPVGSRNDTLNREWYSLLRFVESGELNPREACTALEGAAAEAGLSHHETRRTLASALNARIGGTA